MSAFLTDCPLIIRQQKNCVNLGCARLAIIFQHCRIICAINVSSVKESLSADALNSFAGDAAPRIGTGAYQWRHETAVLDTGTEKYTAYHQFIERINTEEQRLRAWFFSHIRPEEDIIKEILSIDSGQRQKQDPAFNDVSVRLQTKERLSHEYLTGMTASYSPSGYLPGFYLPEPTFMMNLAAHSNVLSDTNIFGNSAQDKESMKIAEKAGVPVSHITYFQDLHVSKPLKNEFKTDSSSYFFNSKMRTFIDSTSYNRIALKNALGGLRQSVFDPSKWYFRSSALLQRLFDAEKEKSLTTLEQFLTASSGSRGNNFSRIKKCLME